MRDPESVKPPAVRWLVLAIGLSGFVAACATQYGLAYLVPALRADGLSLAQAGLLVSAPIAGVLRSLVVWGAITDRVGERWVLAAGMAGAALASWPPPGCTAW